jgi:gliding motility-associated-like protein
MVRHRTHQRSTLNHKKSYIILLLLLLTFFAQSQLTLERQVISPCAVNRFNGQYYYNSTAGQPQTITHFSDSLVITQGFEQPLNKTSLIPALKLYFNECTATFEAEIISIAGCSNLAGAQIMWNGSQGGARATNLPSQTILEIIGSGNCHYQRTIDFNTSTVETLTCDLEFYSMFTPNGDGSNDRWLIRNIAQEAFSDNQITIYNRWGIEVWTAQSYNNDDVIWDGRSSGGADLPDGTYYYAADIGGRLYKGFVEIIR